MNSKIDMARCLRGMKQIQINGYVSSNRSSERKRAIESAITKIQQDPTNALRVEYIGVKHYAGFDEQREDHRYGLGPRHGSTVFSIERIQRKSSPENILDADAIYLLECVRDNGAFEYINTVGNKAKCNISHIISAYENARLEAERLLAIIGKCEVEDNSGNSRGDAVETNKEGVGSE